MMATTSETIEVTVPESRARRLRLYTIAAIGVLAGLTLITTTQTWWTVRLVHQSLVIAGTVAAPALTALTLCGLVLAAALALAGPVFRLILGILQLLVSFTIVFSTIVSLTGPDQPSESAVQTATGIAGSSSIDALIRSVTFTPWGYIAIVLGVLAFLVGVWLLLTFRLWPVASRKYQAVRFEAADGPRDAVIDWDALSDGTDPTAESGPPSGAKPVK
jgi:Tryptophan-associated transmembrane protein (Trp_oprn_chp)